MSDDRHSSRQADSAHGPARGLESTPIVDLESVPTVRDSIVGVITTGESRGMSGVAGANVEGEGSPVRRSALMILCLITISVLVTACTASSQSNGQMTNEMPAWVRSVYPEPGAEASVTDTIQVVYSRPPPGQVVRLLIDGVDVTSDASRGAETIDYDPEKGPVHLTPGEHNVEVRLVVTSPDNSSDQTLDSFHWSFRAG